MPRSSRFDAVELWPLRQAVPAGLLFLTAAASTDLRTYSSRAASRSDWVSQGLKQTLRAGFTPGKGAERPSPVVRTAPVVFTWRRTLRGR